MSVRIRTAALLALATSCGGSEPAHHVHGTLLHAIRPTEVERAQLWRYDAADVVEHHDSGGGAFRIHFTRAGEHAVPAADADETGVPDYVETVAAIYEEVLTFYDGLGFRIPLGDEAITGENGGDGRFDVYLLDFAHSADGAFVTDRCGASGCVGYMVQENDFAGYGYPSRTVGARILASHEFFHAVQAAYGPGGDVVLSEGTAVWASETFDPALSDFEAFVGGYLEDPGRSIDVPPPGPVPRFAYGSAIFFRFLEERFDRSLIAALLEGSGQGAWLDALDQLLAEGHGSSFAEAFLDFGAWNLHLAQAADPAVAYANGADYPQPQMAALQAPVVEERLRVYHASTRYFEVDPGGRSVLAAQVVAPDAAELADLALLAVARTGGRNRGAVQVIAAADGRLVIDAGGADRVIVALSNGSRVNPSRRPTLCVGTEEEVDACAATFGAVDPDPEPVPEPEPPAAASEDGGCSSGGSAGLLGVVVVPLLLLRRSACRHR